MEQIDEDLWESVGEWRKYMVCVYTGKDVTRYED